MGSISAPPPALTPVYEDDERPDWPLFGSSDGGSSKHRPTSSTATTLVQADNMHVYHTKDKLSIIPQHVVENVAADLRRHALLNAVDLQAFAIERDVDADSLMRMIEVFAGRDRTWPRVIIDVDGKSFLCSHAFADREKRAITKILSQVGTSMCDLTAAVGHRIPSPVIVALATEALTSLEGISSGAIRLAGDHVVFLPDCVDCVESREENERKLRVAELVKMLEQNGFCVTSREKGGEKRASAGKAIDEDEIVSKAVMSEYETMHPAAQPPEMLALLPEDAVKGSKISQRTIVLVHPDDLGKELQAMILAVGCRTEIIWQVDRSFATPTNILRSLQRSDFSDSHPSHHNEQLSLLLLRSEHAKDLEAVAAQRIEELDSQRQSRLIEAVEDLLWIPLHLYAAGILHTQDATLKRDLEEYVSDHFCSEKIPHTINILRQQSLFSSSNKAVTGEAGIESLLEPMASSMKSSTPSFEDMQAAIVAVGQELGLQTPAEARVLKAKQAAVEQTLIDMESMTKGLDVLQSMVWVLLATSGPGLWRSSVRYTSKLVRQYEDCFGGDPQISGLVELWWTKVKNGTVDAEDQRQMKELAREAMRMWTEGEVLGKK